MEFVGNITALVVVLATVIGVPTILVEWMRQRGRLKEKVAELHAWRDAQDRIQDEHTRTYLDSVRVQKDGHAQAKENHAAYLSYNDRYIALHEARLKVAQEHLDEVRRTNALLSELLASMHGRPGQGRTGE
jgi:PHD/YefM family antitoxin component YafN of YafNO toxin-antitoxin module